MRYQLAGREGYHVSIVNQPWDFRFSLDYKLPAGGIPAHAEVFGVSFVDHPFDRWLATHAAGPPVAIVGYATEPLLHVYRMN